MQRSTEYVRPEARSAHADDDDGLGLMASNGLAKRGVSDRDFRRGLRKIQPAHPVRFIGIGEDRSLSVPELSALAFRLPRLLCRLDVALCVAERIARAREGRADELLSLGFDREEKSVEGIAEECAALCEEFVRDRLE